MTIDEKLDCLIDWVSNISLRLSVVESKLTAVDAKISALESLALWQARYGDKDVE